MQEGSWVLARDIVDKLLQIVACISTTHGRTVVDTSRTHIGRDINVALLAIRSDTPNRVLVEHNLVETWVTIFVRMLLIIATTLLVDMLTILHLEAIHEVLGRIGTTISTEVTCKTYRQEYLLYLVGTRQTTP